MTKTIQIHVDLKHLSAEEAALVPDFDGDDMSTIHRRPWTTFETLWSTQNGQRVAAAVGASIEVPLALSLSDFALGTSVFAAGWVGLWFVRTALARAGLPKSALDALSIDHVSITSVAVTYMVPCSGWNSSVRLKNLMHQHGLLIGLEIRSHSAINRTRYRIAVAEEVSASTDREICELGGAEVSVDQRLAEGFLQVDVVLEERYLKQRGWESLDSWRNAYLDKRYKRIFDRVVRGMFKLDGSKWQHSEPSKGVVAQLGLRNQLLLREYLQGMDASTFSAFTLGRSGMESSRKKAWREAQKIILKQTGINISKPWKEYRLYYPDALEKQLDYPGDYAPNSEHVPAIFCEEHWPSLRADLLHAYNDATSSAGLRTSGNSVNS